MRCAAGLESMEEAVRLELGRDLLDGLLDVRRLAGPRADDLAAAEHEEDDLRLVDAIDESGELLRLVLDGTEPQGDRDRVQVDLGAEVRRGDDVLDLDLRILRDRDARGLDLFRDQLDCHFDVLQALRAGADDLPAAEEQDGGLRILDSVDEAGELLRLVLGAAEGEGDRLEVELVPEGSRRDDVLNPELGHWDTLWAGIADTDTGGGTCTQPVPYILPSAQNPPGRPNGLLPETAGPRNRETLPDPLRLDALHAAVRLRPPQQAQEGLGLRPVQGDHVPSMVGGPGLPVLDDAQDAVPGLLPHRHELRHLGRGPRVLEGPLEHGEAPVRDDGDLVRHLVQEAAVVAHDQEHARIRPQGGCHDLLALDVEVVRRLVEDEEVVVLGDELREGESRAFSAAELADAAVHRVASEPEAAEEAPRPRLRRRRIPHAADLLEER